VRSLACSAAPSPRDVTQRPSVGSFAGAFAAAAIRRLNVNSLRAATVL